MKKLFFILLCIFPLLIACSSDDNDNNDSQYLTFEELYTGDYEWVTLNGSTENVLRFIDGNKVYFYDGHNLNNCYYYIRKDADGNMECCRNVCGTGDDWEYFSTKKSTWNSFDWVDSSHSAFKVDGQTFTKRTATTIIIRKE